MRWSEAELAAKSFLAKWVSLGFALTALLSFGVVAVQLGTQAIGWLKTGAWQNSKTIAEAFPDIASYVASIQWVGVYHMAAWVIGVSVLWFYVALGVVFFAIFGLMIEVHEDLERRRERQRDQR